MTTLELETSIKELLYSPGDLVYVAGEMHILASVVSNSETSLYSFPQLGLVIAATPTSLLVWFAEFGTNKEREHILVCAPINQPTTKVWTATSALASPGAKDFLDV
ncbi:MAG TPA: hypothetical protein EYQ00_08355 [Dehalococcoidia bacterium]|nr:hypothetical protein [Dehalococcoidia bacterium]